LRRKRRQFSMHRATLSGQSGAPACQECWHLRSREYPERHFLERHFMAFGPHFKQTRSASRAQLAPERTQAFRAGLCAGISRPQAVQECWHFTNAGILRRHFHVSYVMCPCHVSVLCGHASCLMCPVSYVVCYVSCVRCRIIWHMS
jgi:hypothetical protein